MNSLTSWQLLLLLCATSLGEPWAKVVPADTPRPIGQRLGALAPRDTWGQSLRCTERKPVPAGPSPREASLCPAAQSAPGSQRPGQCAPSSRLIPAPRGAVLVQREKDLSSYNWNSFGLRYGKRQTVPGSRAGGAGRG